jgi:hypothetical protein
MARLLSGNVVLDTDWHPLDGVDPPPYVPTTWCGEHVQTKLADAWRVLHKMPWRSPFPRAYGASWPQYRLDWIDVMTAIGAGEFEAMQTRQNHVRILPSAKQISEMEISIVWPLTYLQSERAIRIVNTCAKVKSIDGDLSREMRRRGLRGDPDQWQKLNWRFCDRISDGLRRDRVVVF